MSTRRLRIAIFPLDVIVVSAVNSLATIAADVIVSAAGIPERRCRTAAINNNRLSSGRPNTSSTNDTYCINRPNGKQNKTRGIQVISNLFRNYRLDLLIYFRALLS